MSDPVRFLNGFVQALAAMALYPDGHPSRERAVDVAYMDLDGISSEDGRFSFTFIDGEVAHCHHHLRDLTGWEWGKRFTQAGIERVEFERRIGRDEFEGFLQEILIRLTLSIAGTSENRQMRDLGVRFGALKSSDDDADRHLAPPGVDTLDLTLSDAADSLDWMQGEVTSRGKVPLIEAEAVARSLSVAMHGDRKVMLPLLQLKQYDQYTTTHALNVAVLSMGLAERLGCDPREVRAFGVSGLLHDIGKTKIPIEILTKPGKLTSDEHRLMNEHPVEGARLILGGRDELDLAAVVAYEHHIYLDGRGYPSMHFGRACTLGSRLVHVCDVYDALRTRRPYRDSWPTDQVLAYLESRSGSEFDPDLAQAFVQMMRESEEQVRVLNRTHGTTADVLVGT